jgi:hypothetical protein
VCADCAFLYTTFYTDILNGCVDRPCGLIASIAEDRNFLELLFDRTDSPRPSSTAHAEPVAPHQAHSILYRAHCGAHPSHMVTHPNAEVASTHAPDAKATGSRTSSVTQIEEEPAGEVGGFLASWNAVIRPKFGPLLSALSKTPLASSILCCQIFSYLPVLERNVQALQAEDMCLLSGQELEGFHRSCHLEGIALDAVGAGPMGKVWENGDVHVVQYPTNLSSTAYPMDRFPPEAMLSLGEVVFLPVYDGRPDSPTPGIVAVVECMLNKLTTTDMIVAKVISALGDIMLGLGLSLNPPSKMPHEQFQPRQSMDGSIERSGSFVRNDKAFASMQRSASKARLLD